MKSIIFIIQIVSCLMSIGLSLYCIYYCFYLRKLIKLQNKLNNMENKLELNEKKVENMDIKSNYILSLTHIDGDLYNLKCEDNKEYKVRKVDAGNPNCDQYFIENIDKDAIDKIKKGGNYISAGFNIEKIENISDGVGYHYKTGTLKKKDHKPIKIPDNLEIVSTKKMYIEDTQPALGDYKPNQIRKRIKFESPNIDRKTPISVELTEVDSEGNIKVLKTLNKKENNI